MFARSVQSYHAVRYYEPITPGTALSTRGKVVGCHPAGKGTEVHFSLETVASSGQLVVEQALILHARRVRTTASLGARVDIFEPFHGEGGRRMPTIATTVDDNQAARYAEASGDKMAIHLDDAIAKRAGLPGVILHGLCTLAFASWALITCPGCRKS
jgi:acyl dehydratase